MAESYSKNYFTPKNIVIYLIVGALVYGLIYYLFLGKKAGYGNQPASQNYMGGRASDTPKDTTFDLFPQQIQLAAQNGSKETGTVTFSDENRKTKVVVSLTGEPAGGSQPAHIHIGQCPAPDGVKYPLSNVVDGKSETVLDVTIQDLLKQLPLAVNVHKSNTEIKKYVACGDIKK